MATHVGPLKSSANAGELSPDLKHKVGLKQFYSAAQAMKNLEPIPQSGFALMPGTVFVANLPSAIGQPPVLRMFVLRVSRGISYTLFFTVGRIDIYRADRSFAVDLAPLS